MSPSAASQFYIQGALQLQFCNYTLLCWNPVGCELARSTHIQIQEAPDLRLNPLSHGHAGEKHFLFNPLSCGLPSDMADKGL